MNHPNQDTAILLFARSANYESTQKNFQDGLSLRKNAEVSARLLENAFQKCESSGLPVYHIDESRQIGSDFASRLKNSFQLIFSLGFKNVIAVGNDCPGLKVRDISKAQLNLSLEYPVLGATQKGAVYIMGICRSTFENFDFDIISWGTKKVFKQIHAQLSRSSKVKILKTRIEINQLTDILISHFGEVSLLLKSLISIGSKSIRPVEKNVLPSYITLSSQNRFRGPPR